MTKTLDTVEEASAALTANWWLWLMMMIRENEGDLIGAAARYT